MYLSNFVIMFLQKRKLYQLGNKYQIVRTVLQATLEETILLKSVSLMMLFVYHLVSHKNEAQMTHETILVLNSDNGSYF